MQRRRMRVKGSRNTIIFIVGPTAIGKTRLSVKLARRIKGEIISCDSMQVYKGMPILSQVPSALEKAGAKHHLAGILDGRKEYSAALFRQKASRIIKSIIRRKRIPVVVGGSGLYARALIDGLFPSPQADIKFRKRMQAFLSRYGSKKLHARLSRVDAEAASHIHSNDARRIIRALEIYESTGRTMTELKASTKGLKDEYDIKIFGLTKPRDELYAAIDARVDEMFASGILAEVKRLRKKRLSKTAAAALGFKEIAGYLDGGYGLDYAKDILKMNTRRLAKRQLTWFRADGRIRWFDLSTVREAEVVRQIVRCMKG